MEPHSISESIWRAVVSGGVNTVRLFGGGNLANWDVAASPLRTLALRLTGHNLKVEIFIPEPNKHMLDISNIYPLASLSEHPDVEVTAIDDFPKAGDGYLLAETLGAKIIKWAVRDVSGIEVNLGWGVSENSLVKAKDGENLKLSSHKLSMQELLPPSKPGDRCVDIGAEIDGPVQGFGNRFWNMVMSTESLAAELLNSSNEKIVGISYSDRYLANPLSVALLAQIVNGLKLLVGSRWEVTSANVSLLKKAGNSNYYTNQLWHDWQDIVSRTDVIKLVFQSIGLQTSVNVLDHISSIEHGRPLRIRLSSERIIEVRFDQGMGHWRIPQSTNYQLRRFDFNLAASDQFARLRTVNNLVEGQQANTQVFLSVRDERG